MKKKSAKPMAKQSFFKTVKRWYNCKMTAEQMAQYVVGLQVKFRKYRYSIYYLWRCALKIQHWFFKKRRYERKI